MPDIPIRHAHRITKRLDTAGAAARRITTGAKPIDLSRSLACQITSLCADACRLELHAATCDQKESPTATLATTIAIREIARLAHNIILTPTPTPLRKSTPS